MCIIEYLLMYFLKTNIISNLGKFFHDFTLFSLYEFGFKKCKKYFSPIILSLNLKQNYLFISQIYYKENITSDYTMNVKVLYTENTTIHFTENVTVYFTGNKTVYYTE